MAADICPRAASSRLHQAFLSGAQLARTFLDLAFELFAVTLAQARQAQTLADEQRGEHQAQPHRCSTQCSVATGSVDLGFAQQVQGPVLAFQWQALPKKFGAAIRALHAAQMTVAGKASQHLMLKRYQRLLVVLTGFGQLGTVGATQGF